MNKPALRAKILEARRGVPADEAARAALKAATHAWQLPCLQRARRIAAYFPHGPELNCETLLENAWERGRETYLPVLSGNQLRFRRFSSRTPLTLNRFGIPEPASGRLISGLALDVVIAPLVAFDADGVRLGMGGGFYDRTFRFLRFRKSWRHPRLLGFAYELQRVEQLQSEAWDIPLDVAVTESGIYEFSPK